ncbi:MAG: DUF2262 domain-containing protein [Bacteroidales bacterium]|jgi:hypothetical protein|nr:DUF2262 domain-containing protein [Bacteroidales bacterium]
MKKTGWEIDNILIALENNSNDVAEFCKDNPLSCINSDKSMVAIIRKHNYCIDGDAVNMLSAKPYGDDGHWGLTVIDLNRKNDRIREVPVPENFNYKTVTIIDQSVHIKTDEKELITNFNELDRLFPFIHNYTESELTDVFNSLKNDVVEKEKIVRKLPKEDSIEIKEIGTIKLNEDKDQFSVNALWLCKSIELEFPVDNNGEVTQGIETVKELWKHQSVWDDKAKRYAAGKLLDLKNEVWFDDDEKEINTTQFINRMQLEALILSEEGCFEFVFDDGDLFWGHYIQVFGNINEGLTDAIFGG